MEFIATGFRRRRRIKKWIPVLKQVLISDKR
jgi:hypothetical protein